jgi:hypothetical protein
MISNDLLMEGYSISGYVLRNDDGEAAIVEHGVTRKLTLDEMFNVMHPKLACPKCGGAMRDGIMEQTWIGEEDLGGIPTMSPGGPGLVVECLKCIKCGHSVV